MRYIDITPTEDTEPTYSTWQVVSGIATGIVAVGILIYTIASLTIALF